MRLKVLNENLDKETDKLYKAISDTADAIDDLDDHDEKSTKKNPEKADDNINDVKDGLTEEVENLHPVPESYAIESLKPFDKDKKRLKLTDKDIEELKQELKKRPPKANIGSGVYKFEWWPKRFNLGKGEGRVIYIEYVEDSRVWLATMYQKNEKSDLTPKEKNDIIKVAEIIRGGNK